MFEVSHNTAFLKLNQSPLPSEMPGGVYLKCKFLSLTQNQDLWRHSLGIYTFNKLPWQLSSTHKFQNYCFKDKIICCEEHYPVRGI